MIAGKRWLLNGGRWLTSLGLVFLAVFAGSLIHRFLSSRQALQEFDNAKAVVTREEPKASVEMQADAQPDFTLWSKNRVLAYSASLQRKKGSTLAVLRFEKLNLRVPVFAGTDEVTLNRGAGWIEGTAWPGAAGNVGIAGHRDGFFRGLKDATKGDTIELATVVHTASYTVDQIEIVNPENVAVLQPRAVPSLTLVTCYPFYFVGEAPQRFIVHAALSK